MNSMTLYNVYDNADYSSVGQKHIMMTTKEGTKDVGSVIHCEVAAKKCSTLEEFNSLTGP